MLSAKQKIDCDNHCEIIPFDKTGHSTNAGRYLNIACNQFPVLEKAVRTYGNHTLLEYLDAIQPRPKPAIQPLGDFLEAIEDCAAPLLGEKIARQAVVDIERSPMVLTANHHGIAYFAQDFQGGIIFALNRMRDEDCLRTVPVIACGTIPLDNLTYPLGLLVYRANDEGISALPKKIPLFSNKMRRQMVSCAKPFDTDMIIRTQRKAETLIEDHSLCSSVYETIQRLLKEEYLSPRVIQLPNYSQQSVVFNNAIWNHAFNKVINAPEIVNLELEKISSILLEKDLTNCNSLVHCIMFDTKLRESVLKELDGKKSCWQKKMLINRLGPDYPSKNRISTSSYCGTMFFWGLNDRGRRVPLCLKTIAPNNEKLCGIDDRGKTFEIPFSPGTIRENLKKGKILPSIFTSFLVMSLARGVTCAGGYFQCDYLPAMQRGLVNALNATSGYDIVAQQVSHVTTDTYLSGMVAVMTRFADNYLIPAGPIEILAGGGLDESDVFRLQSLTVREAHLSALSETIPDLPVEIRNTISPNYKAEIAEDNNRLLTDKVVVK